MGYKKRYFNTFDALRFFAFFKVYLLHLPIVAFPAFNFIKNGGDIGVSFFFVLSGFLITHILLEEKTITHKVNLKRFFLRRVLRIWPLYYLMVLFAFLTPTIINIFELKYSNVGYEPDWLLTCLFLENYKMIWTGDFPNVSPLVVMWSLCVEEHFYILWGFLLYCLPISRVPQLIVISIITTLISRYVFSLYGWPFLDISTNIGFFAFGAIPAYALITKSAAFEDYILQIPKWIKYLYVLTLVLFVLICPFWKNAYAYLILPILLGLLLSGLISLTIPLNNALYISKNSIMSKLGALTYGLYMYHTIVISFALQLFKSYAFTLENAFFALLFIFITLLGSVVVSVASYYFFERYFLRVKKYFKPI